MVRKMSDDDKTEKEKLIELQNYFNRIRKSRTKRTLEQPTTDYGYLNSYLADNIDSYVLQFDYIGDQVSSQYAQDLKQKLATQNIVGVKDLDNFGDPQPKKIIVFQDGSEETVPMTLIEKADSQQQNKLNEIQQNNDELVDKLKTLGGTSPLETNQQDDLALLREQEEKRIEQLGLDERLLESRRNEAITNAQFDPTGGNPLFSSTQLQSEPMTEERREQIRQMAEDSIARANVSNDQIIFDKDFRYVLNEKENKLSIQELQDDGTYKEVMDMADFEKKSEKVQDQIIKNIEKARTAQKQRIAEEYSLGMADVDRFITQPTEAGAEIPTTQPTETGAEIPTTQPTLETVAEKIAEEEPKKLTSLGEKVKKGFQDLSTEQKAMMGLMGLDVAGEVVNYFGPARREGRERLRELEQRREQGQLGVDERQDAETMKYMTRPVRAMAEESEREQQAVMAGMGETRSASDLRRLRESRDAQMTDALSRAGQEVARQQMARKEAERRELNQLQAYQQENLRNLTNRISGSVAQMAGTFGANVAAEADIQKELSPDNVDKYMKILMESNPNLTPEEARRMATDYGLERAKKKIDYSKMFTGINQFPF